MLFGSHNGENNANVVKRSFSSYHRASNYCLHIHDGSIIQTTRITFNARNYLNTYS